MFKDNNSPTWVVAYASVIGNGHLLMNLPCQDSNVHKQLNNTWGVAVVADGAGSAAKSDIGSDFKSYADLTKAEGEATLIQWAKDKLGSDRVAQLEDVALGNVNIHNATMNLKKESSSNFPNLPAETVTE